MQYWRVGQQKKSILIETQRNEVFLFRDQEATDVVIIGLLSFKRSVNKVQLPSCDYLQFRRPAMRHIYSFPNGAVPAEQVISLMIALELPHSHLLFKHRDHLPFTSSLLFALSQHPILHAITELLLALTLASHVETADRGDGQGLAQAGESGIFGLDAGYLEAIEFISHAVVFIREERVEVGKGSAIPATEKDTTSFFRSPR